MDRREAIRSISLLLGGTVVGGTYFLTGCRANETTTLTFTKDDVAFLDEVADTILPDTETPGAKAAKVGEFMTVMVNDCYEKEDQEIFHKGIKQLNDVSTKKYGKGFMKLTPAQRTEMLVALDQEQKDFQKNKKPEERSHYFRMMKELTLLGYFTSEIGCTQARRYVERPGSYNGCLPYKKGDKAWA
ncbi:MAG: gluconate 2-dehydrogenase subunit 3 family protein [Chitinophagaceae bacterium]|nr:gluconate 2-dehydrogenase subunit 3 family protein [Chitinophagaceae bacterium]MCW5914967.1 gluconate 2-dehydrogenase subunit 3 family protein [Chitinophagaceae bacterium]MCZ2396764.1 gluconate 2-dehydrogenase subunit 3 family protein [Chitinophagales bacterium]